jgi:hypothetical protein
VTIQQKNISETCHLQKRWSWYAPKYP